MNVQRIICPVCEEAPLQVSCDSNTTIMLRREEFKNDMIRAYESEAKLNTIYDNDRRLVCSGDKCSWEIGNDHEDLEGVDSGAEKKLRYIFSNFKIISIGGEEV